MIVKEGYRQEIDGLRAIAIISVIFFHANASFVQGGFIGVDIFFVISGYLITKLALVEIETHKSFSMKSFYLRRLRRLWPALSVMVFATMILSFLLAPPALIEYYQSLISIPAFLSNFVFWQQSGYFQEAASRKLLLHTWSLAVEEQFYFIFPFLFVFFIRIRRKLAIALLILLFLGSLIFSHWASINHPNPNFYLLPGRIWEIMAGAFVGIISHKKKLSGNNNLALVGLIFIIISITFGSKNILHPSVFTAIPVFSTCLIILFATADTKVGCFLSNKVFVRIGVLSYSLYLWHHPIFSLAKIVADFSSIAVQFISFSITYSIAFLSYKYIEDPIRKRRKLKGNMIIIYGLISALFILIFGVVGLFYKGFYKLRFDPNSHSNIEQLLNDNNYYVTSGFNQKSQYRWAKNDNRLRLMIIGDSYAQDIFNSFFESGLTQKYQVQTHRIGAKCGNIFLSNEKLKKFQPQKIQKRCLHVNLVDNPKVQKIILEADIVVFASQWRGWQIDLMDKGLNKLKSQFDGEIFLFGTKYLITPNIYSTQHLTAVQKYNYSVDIEFDVSHLNKRLGLIAHRNNLKYIDVQRLICDLPSPQCKPFDATGLFKSFDNGHLTKAGALYLGQRLKPYFGF